MEVTKELMVEAIDLLFAAEADTQAEDARARWKSVMAELERHQQNLDFILARLRRGWFEMEGPWCKTYVRAVVYRAVCKTLYGPGAWKRGKDLEYRRHWFKRKERARKDLKEAVEQCRDCEMEKSGCYVVWHLMAKWHGYAHRMVSSSNKEFVMVEYRDALRNARNGAVYYVAKEYVPRKQKDEKKGGCDE